MQIDSGRCTSIEKMEKLKASVKTGDIVNVKSMASLGSNNSELLEILEYFAVQGVTVKFVDSGLSTEDREIVDVLRAVVKSERARMMERTNEGLAEAKANGVQLGRKRNIDRDQLKALHASGKGATEIATKMGIGRSTVYKILKDFSC